MATVSLNLINWNARYSNGGWTGAVAITSGGENGNYAGAGYYTVVQVSWSNISNASKLKTLSFTTNLRKNSATSVPVQAILSTKAYGGTPPSTAADIVQEKLQYVTFESTNYNVKQVTFTFDISGRSIAGETLYIWLGGNTLFNHFPSGSSTGGNWSGLIEYDVKTYTISYNANGYGSAPASQVKTHGTALTLQPFISNQTGSGYLVSYNANGGSSTPTSHRSTTAKTQTAWNTNSSGSGTSYGSKGSYTSNSAATLYAIWSSSNNAVTLAGAISRSSGQNNYTISYNANGGTSTPSSQTLTRTTPYSFSKWAAGSTSGTQYSAGSSFTPSSDTMMYAIWSAGTTTGSISLAAAISKSDTYTTGYTVAFNANGGNCSTSSLTVADTVKWTFNKWNTKADGTGTSYSAGAIYSSSANLTLYATWNSTTNKGSITLPTPTRAGYNFAGWATSTTASSGAIGLYTPTENIVLYAIWVADGSIRIWHNGEYRMALVYVYSGGKWNLTLPYIYDSSQSKWRILGG